MECPVTGAKAGNGVDMCPVIKGVNEEEAKQIQQQQQELKPNEAATAATTTTTTEKDGTLSDAFDFDSEFANEIPSVASYKKMRNIMKLITGFYRKGTETKRIQYECKMIACFILQCCSRSLISTSLNPQKKNMQHWKKM